MSHESTVNHESEAVAITNDNNFDLSKSTHYEEFDDDDEIESRWESLFFKIDLQKNNNLILK